jgi:hypothetical protein
VEDGHSMKNIEVDRERLEDENMQLELHIADVVNDYKNKTNEKKLKIRGIKRHAREKKICIQYAFGTITILDQEIVVAMIGGNAF